MADSLTIVSASPASGVVSTSTGGVSVRFVPEQFTSDVVKWRLHLLSDSSVVHTEDVSGSVVKSGTQWSVQCAVASYLTAGTEYYVSVTAYRTGQSNVWVNALTFTAYDNPSVTITSPADGGTVNGMPLGVAWTISDSTGVSEQILNISKGATFDPTQIVYTGGYYDSWDTDTRAVSVTADKLFEQFESGETYTAWMQVTNGVGLRTSVENDFTISWAAPVEPSATLSVDTSDMSVDVTVQGDRSHSIGSGESLAVTGEGGYVAPLTIHGKSVQDGTPTPSTPVEIRSVESGNLLSMTDRKGSTATSTKGVDITWNLDGWIDVSGTVTGTSAGALNLWGDSTNPFTSAGTYTVIVESDGIEFSTKVRLQIYNGSDTTAYINSSTHYVTFTYATGIKRIALYLYSTATGLVLDGRIRVKLVQGTVATPWTPYDAILLNAGTNETPIDLQSHALRSLPDGTEDELTVDAAGAYGIEQSIDETDMGSLSWTATTLNGAQIFYSNEITGREGGTRVMSPSFASVAGTCYDISADGQISDYNGQNGRVAARWDACADATAFKTAVSGVKLYFKLATPQTISLGTITPPMVADGDTVWVDAEVTPTIDGTVTVADYFGQPATDSIMLTRVSPDGTRWVVANGLSSGDTVTDPLPPLGVEYAYEVTSSATSGATATKSLSESIPSSVWAMNFGANAELYTSARFNPKASHSLTHGGESYHFAGGGLPVWYGTTDRDENGSIQWDVVGVQDVDALYALVNEHPVGWLRDPFGHRWRAHMTPKDSRGLGEVWQLSIDWDAVRWEEAW